MNISSDIIILLLPLIVVLAIWLFRWLEQRLPEKQRQALDQFVSIAVRNVEQELDTVPNSQKKEAAMMIVKQFFTFFKLPVPDAAIIGVAIEACVWEMQNRWKLNPVVDADKPVTLIGGPA